VSPSLRSPSARLLSSNRVRAAALAVVLVLFGYDVIQYFSFVIQTPWQLDFSDFYFAARTGLSHGWAEMYNTTVSMPALYAATGNWFPFQHSPVLAWLLVPLSLLPYALALTIWDGFLFGCYLFCWRILAPGSIGRRLLLLVAGLALYPVVLGLALGQPTVLVLAGVSASYWLLRRNRPLLAALALALIAVKPQSSFLVPFALLFAGRIRLFAGWAAISIGLAGLTLLALGQQGLQDWLHAIAIANLAEVASGTAMLMALPPGTRGIVTALSVTYLKKARGTVIAECNCRLPEIHGELPFDVQADVTDATGDVVARATVTWLLRRER